jgi:signal peptidase I
MSRTSSEHDDSPIVHNGARPALEDASPASDNGAVPISDNGAASPPENGNGPATTVGHDPESATRPPADQLADGSGRHNGDLATGRATAVRSAEELDYRLRGLRLEPTDAVPTTPARKDHGQRHRRRRLLARVAVFAAVAALAVLLLQAFVVQPFSVPGNAMAPNLQAGDQILVLKSGLLEGPIRSGEIVVFHPPQTLPCTVVGGRSGDLVLRVVALPGQAIWSFGDTIFVDGRPLHEHGWYDPRFGQVGSTPIRSTTLPRGQYFVMADNRSDACDSRVFGPISTSSVVGEAIAVVGRDGHVFFGTL